MLVMQYETVINSLWNVMIVYSYLVFLYFVFDVLKWIPLRDFVPELLLTCGELYQCVQK